LFFCSAFESGAEGQVGSLIKITYKDNSVWTIRVTEFSERHHTLGYELVSAEPAYHATSLQGEIKLMAVTTESSTFVSWETQFSNDVDLAVISDQKYKKEEFFKGVKASVN